MCGICGKLNTEPQRRVEPQLIDRMMGAIAHRGPDGQGKYLAAPIGLGHTRLAIIDLSTGDQPMTNEDGSLWLVYNGEIYNFQELRTQLEAKGHVFASHTDTEVIVHLYEEYGTDCLQHLSGMFAFALWDSRKRTLFLARDRVGIKPLYYTQTKTALLFASEIKALLCDPDVQRSINPHAIARYLSFLYLPGQETLLQGIHKLEPGHYLLAKDGGITTHRYWDLEFRPSTAPLSFNQTAKALNTRIHQSVRDHMISDVPVGVLLSGGVDSTIVLACAAQNTNQRINTFTIGFAGQEFEDERPYARLAAAQFETNHHEITIAPHQFADFLPSYIRHLEEPVCEAPAVALHYVSQLARKHVKVVLSGEGSDEAFGGYQNYRNLLLFEKLKQLAGPHRETLQKALSHSGLQKRVPQLKKYAPLATVPLSSYYYSRTATPFGYFPTHLYHLCTSGLLSQVNHAASANHVAALFGQVTAQAKNQPLLNQMLYVDTKTWLPDDLLIKADKMTMANSLELRVPLLDHSLLEFAATLPPSYKVNGWATKRILKAAFKNEIPAAIIQRKKTGLPVPLRRWMRMDLAAYTRETLLSKQAIGRGYFTQKGLQRLLADNEQTGALMKEVFALLTLELWHKEFIDSPSYRP